MMLDRIALDRRLGQRAQEGILLHRLQGVMQEWKVNHPGTSFLLKLQVVFPGSQPKQHVLRPHSGWLEIPK